MAGRDRLCSVPAQEHQGPERRQHVRVRPTAEYEVRANLLAGPISERLEVVDLSVGGAKLLLNAGLEGYSAGSVLRLRVETPRSEPVELDAELRYLSKAYGICGLRFKNSSEEARRAIRVAVADLMERGSLA